MNERGSLLPLVAGIVSLCGVVVVGIIGSTDLALTRTELQSVADGAALAAAGAIDPALATVTATSAVVRLTPQGVRRDANAFLRDTAKPGVRLAAATTPDSLTAVVTLSQVWRPPILSEFLPVRLQLTATARARNVLG